MKRLSATFKLSVEQVGMFTLIDMWSSHCGSGSGSAE